MQIRLLILHSFIYITLVLAGAFRHRGTSFEFGGGAAVPEKIKKESTGSTDEDQKNSDRKSSYTSEGSF